MRRVLSAICLTLIGAVVLLHGQTKPITLNAQMNPLSGTWQGELHFPQGATMRMILLITEQNATLAAKVHISNQGPSLLVVDPINRSGQTLNFEITKLNGRFSGTIVGDHIKGTFTHSGTNIPLTLTRTARPMPRPVAN
jgi:hypothetical protein